MAKYNIPITKPFVDDREERAVSDVIRSGWLTQGPKVKEFEEKVAQYVNASHAVAVSSCTAALHLALLASGVGPGDEVIVPSLSFIATANSITYSAASPVFVDINPETCNLDPERIEEAITPKTKAIMPVHQMGLPAELEAIMALADTYRLTVVEDAACAIGSAYKGRRIGSHGNSACFSFHPRKVITTGEGGIIVTRDASRAERLRHLRHQGMSVSDLERHRSGKPIIEEYPEVGYNYRMTDMQAALGVVQMERLQEIIERRRTLAERYNDAFSEVPTIKAPVISGDMFHNYQSYWVELLEEAGISRDGLMTELLRRGIATRRGIMAIHLEKPYADCVRHPLPETEKMTEHTVILPLYPGMTFEEQDYVIRSIKDIL